MDILDLEKSGFCFIDLNMEIILRSFIFMFVYLRFIFNLKLAMKIVS